jgi:hypothetical protein
LRKSENYGDAEFLDALPCVIDLVPLRLPVAALFVLLGLAVIAGLEVLYAWMPQFALAVDGRIEAFDLAGTATLATWFSTVALVLAGMVSLVVYLVRRFRTDDYRGHYRVWLWAALCWFLLSIDQVASLHELLRQAATRLSGTPLYGDGAAWWMIAYALVLGAVGTRLAVEMFPCPAALVVLLASLGSYAVVAACRFGWVPAAVANRLVMLSAGGQLLGNYLILVAVTIYARHVILDAQGLLEKREPRPAAEEKTARGRRASAEAAEEEETEECQAGSPGPAPLVVRPGYASAAPSVAGSLADPSQPAPSLAQAEADAGRRLTKQERKALRERLARLQSERQKRAG